MSKPIPPRLASMLAGIDSEITHELRKSEEHREAADALRQERAQLIEPYEDDTTATPALPTPAEFPDERHMYKGGSLWTVAGRHGAEKRDREMRWRVGGLVVEYFYSHGSNTRALRAAGVGTQERGGGWYSVAELNQYCRQAVAA
jgi:hypothetical protein